VTIRNSQTFEYQQSVTTTQARKMWIVRQNFLNLLCGDPYKKVRSDTDQHVDRKLRCKSQPKSHITLRQDVAQVISECVFKTSISRVICSRRAARAASGDWVVQINTTTSVDLV
jgi:hypothetical protein